MNIETIKLVNENVMKVMKTRDSYYGILNLFICIFYVNYHVQCEFCMIDLAYDTFTYFVSKVFKKG